MTRRVTFKPRCLIVLIGAVVTGSSWFVANSDQFPFVYAVVSPAYARAFAGFSQLNSEGGVLAQGEKGFNEVAHLVEQDFTGEVEVLITKIETISFGETLADVPTGLAPVEFHEIRVSLSNHPPVTGNVINIKARIRDTYLNKNLFRTSSIIFWAGLIVTVIAGVI